MERNELLGGPTRRQVLIGLGAGGTAALAGCLGGGEGGADPVPVRGDPEADVVLEVFADLNCPFCADYNENGFPDVQSQFLDDGLIRYEFRNFVTTGTAGEQAASAAREVFDRHGNDAFWQFKTAMYDNQDRMPAQIPEVFADVASNLDLDADAIAEAGNDRSYQNAVESDIDRGRSLGVQGTPSFVVDDSLVNTRGANTMERVVSRVAQEIQSALASQ